MKNISISISVINRIKINNHWVNNITIDKMNEIANEFNKNIDANI